jgi:hypothetical protein
MLWRWALASYWDVVDERGPGDAVADAGLDLVEEAALVVAGLELGLVGLGG